MATIKKTGLGKGLDALFSSTVLEQNDENIVKQLKINEIEPNKGQARKIFDDDSMKLLLVKEDGELQKELD